MKTLTLLAAGGWLALLAACKTLDAPNQNYGTLGDLTHGTPSRVAVATATQALLGFGQGFQGGGLRSAFFDNAESQGWLGREVYNLDVSNPDLAEVFLQSGIIHAYWDPAYATMNEANVVMKALANVVGMTDAEKEGVRGFAKTIKAISLFYVIREMDIGGAALDALADPTAPPPDIKDTAAVYAQILTYLDEARTHLQAATEPFPFEMPRGFSNFSAPADFLAFNRGIRAKVDVTRMDYARALTDLQSSFLDPSQPLSYGAYHTFSTNSGDLNNGLFDPTARQRYAHASFATDAKEPLSCFSLKTSWQKWCTPSPTRASGGAIPIPMRMCVSFVRACEKLRLLCLPLLTFLQLCVIRMMTWYLPLPAPQTQHTSSPETLTS